MEQFAQLGSDMVRLWSQYSGSYLNGIKNTLILAVVATLIGCLDRLCLWCVEHHSLYQK